MKKRAFLFTLCIVLLGGLIVHCSRQTEPKPGSDVSTARSGRANLLSGRTNPLLTFIRGHWTNGDQTSTRGLHFNHIKIYGHSYVNLSWPKFTNGVEQAQFIASHFDMYAWGGPPVRNYADPNDFIWIIETANLETLKYSCAQWPYMCEWLADPEKNPNGYTYDDFLMHAKYNYTNAYGNFIPGWNPADDWNGDGCISSEEGCSGSPCDPNRSAQCFSDSRASYQVDTDNMPRYQAPYQFWLTSRLVDLLDEWEPHMKGTHFDVVGTNPGCVSTYMPGLSNTFEYEGQDECAESFQYIIDKYATIPAVIAAAENISGTTIIALANTIMPYYNCNFPTQKMASLTYLENLFNECWMTTPSSVPFNTGNIDGYLNCPYLDFMEQGKGYIFTCLDENSPDDTGSDRGRGFSLATFYMINHQMAFYYYRTHGHETMAPPNPPVWVTQWNPLVLFDVGQPNVNALGLPDFQGQMNTNKYFIWKDHADYKILGREFLRDDGRRVLVLTKIMASGRTEGADPTTHTLPLKWYRLMPDLTWSSPLTQITLSNNEGAILLKYNKGEEPPPNIQQEP